MSFSFIKRPMAVIVCALPFAASAQTSAPITELENIVVTPGRMDQLRSEAVGDVTVIDRKELERAGQSSVAETLSRHHGISFTNSGGPQANTSVFIRGTNANQSLVLIDGLRINGSTAGAINWNTIDPAVIERIEIVRGAGSSLYGTDAIGGVINIITRKTGEDRPFSAYANIGMGTHDTVKSSIGLSGASQGWDYALSSSVASSKGFNATTPSSSSYSPDRDGYHSNAVSGSLGYQILPGHHIGLTAFNSYNNADADGGAFAQDPYKVKTRQQAYSVTSTNTLTDYWESRLRFGFTKELGDDRGYNSQYGSQQKSYSWQNTFTPLKDQAVSVLLERLEERALGNINHTQTHRDTNAAGLIYRGKFNIHHLQASIRNDNITGYGSHTTGGLGYEIDLAPNWQAGLGANTGFKAPTFNDLYGPAGWRPNPNLLPEKSRNVEASLRYSDDHTTASVVVYQNKIRNLIVSDQNWNLQNVGSATIRGVTLTGSKHWGSTTLTASADFMNPQNNDTDRELNRRARQVYRLSAEHRLADWTLGTEYQFTGKRYDDVANNTRLGGYGLLNLTASFDFSKHAAIQVRWNNVTDKDYATAYGYQMPGSNVFVNLMLRM